MTIRRILYQAEANAPKFPAATTTPTTAGVRDQDPPLSRAHAIMVGVVVASQFVASTPFPPPGAPQAQPVEAVTRVRSKPVSDLTAWASAAQAANTPITAGLMQDFPALRVQPKAIPDLTAWLSQGQAANTPITAGLQDFTALTPVRRRWPLGEGTFAISAQAAVTPSVAVPAFVDAPRVFLGRWQIADFAGAAAAPVATPTAQVMDWYQPRRPPLRVGDVAVNLAPTTPVATTPATAGVQGFDFRFIRPFKAALQHVTGFGPAGFITAGTATPITAGLQDFAPWLFVKRFGAHLQQDHALAPRGYVANTPSTGLQAVFDPVRARRPVGAPFDAQAPTPAPFAWVPAPEPPPRALARRDAQAFLLTVPAVGQAVVAPQPEFPMLLRARLRPQDAFAWAPLVVQPPAPTPSAFSFAIASQPPVRYGMRASLQVFMWATLRPGITSPPSIVAQPNLLGEEPDGNPTGQLPNGGLQGKVG